MFPLTEDALAIQDGKQKDSTIGTVFEIGYAISINKPVIVFVQNADEKDLTMIKGTGCKIVNDFVTAIYQTVWTAMQMKI